MSASPVRCGGVAGILKGVRGWLAVGEPQDAKVDAACKQASKQVKSSSSACMMVHRTRWPATDWGNALGLLGRPRCIWRRSFTTTACTAVVGAGGGCMCVRRPVRHDARVVGACLLAGTLASDNWSRRRRRSPSFKARPAQRPPRLGRVLRAPNGLGPDRPGPNVIEHQPHAAVEGCGDGFSIDTGRSNPLNSGRRGLID